MGIVNVTPDSFSDGGRFFDPAAATAHGLALAEQGADLIDVGGESSRPGSLPVSLDEELHRVRPVVEALAKLAAVPISVDTSKAEVARQALAAGASVVNDVTALRGDPEMPQLVRTTGAGVVLMHMQGTPATMQVAPLYDNVLADLDCFFEDRLHELTGRGIAVEQLALDPGFGFGKTDVHNLTILAGLGRLTRFGRPLCLGVSRKGFLGRLTGRPASERADASLAAACHGLSRGWVQIVRTHDVAGTRDAVRVLEAIAGASVSPA
jgi:dihydropteroate synthase